MTVNRRRAPPHPLLLPGSQQRDPTPALGKIATYSHRLPPLSARRRWSARKSSLRPQQQQQQQSPTASEQHSLTTTGTRSPRLAAPRTVPSPLTPAAQSAQLLRAIAVAEVGMRQPFRRAPRQREEATVRAVIVPPATDVTVDIQPATPRGDFPPTQEEEARPNHHQPATLHSILMLDDDDDDDDKEDADVTAAANQEQPLKNLQNFVVTARETEPDLLAPFVNLLSPAADAPLRTVSWLSRVPAGLFPRLSQGARPLQRLTLGCFARPEQYVREVWPLLRNLGQRPIMNLYVDLPSWAEDDDEDEEEDQDEDLTVEEFLSDLPHTIKLVETTPAAKEEDRDPYVFDTGFDNQFLHSILARPRAPSLTLHEDGSVSTSWMGKPRAQTVVLSVRAFSPDNVEVTARLKLARYHNEPGGASHLSEWHVVSPHAIDVQGNRDPSAGPQALADLVVRGLISQLS